jgi:uncharacterized membrane protein required for colicin V production
LDKATLIFGVVVLLFVFRGWFLGFPRVAVRLLALAAGYEAAIAFSSPVAAWLGENTALDGFLPMVAAMIGLFLTAVLLVAVPATFFLRWLREEDDDGEGRASRAGGATFHGVFGALVAVPVVWLSAQAHATLYPGDEFSDSAIQRLSQSAASEVFTRLAERAQPDNPAHARMVGEVAARPAETMQDLRALAESKKVQKALYDRRVRAALSRGDVDAVLREPAWQKLAEDKRFRELMTRSGLVPADAGQAERNRAMAAEFSDLMRRVEAVRDHPRFREIVEQPDFNKKLYSGNLWDVMSDPRSKELVTLVQQAEPEPAQPAGAAQPRTSESAEASGDETENADADKETTEIHKWQDEQGNWHFTDRRGKR